MKILILFLSVLPMLALGVSRDQWQQPAKVMKTLALDKNKDVVCDIGAGDGYFSFKLAKQAKKVIAVEVEAEAVNKLKNEVTNRQVKNIDVVLGKYHDPLLKAQSCSVIFFALVYHHIENRVVYLKNIKKALKPGGRIINIDNVNDITAYTGTKKRLPSKECRFPRTKFLIEARAAGFSLASSHNFLGFQYFDELVLK